MKLIMEGASLLTGHYEDELNEASGSTERNYYISGTFSTPEAKNRNGRVYSRNIWEREVAKYQKEINERSINTLGEWQHPPRSTVDPLKAVLRIVKLRIDETGKVVGKAKILNNNTEATNSIKGLIKEGIKIGVSSRGVGKVSATGIVEDFKLITYDAVDMPSDYNAMLNGVVEGVHFINGIAQDKEYRVDENGCVGEICGLDGAELVESEEVKEKCPIQEKIDEAIANAKEEIYSNINNYLEESFKEVSTERETLIESISEYLSSDDIIKEDTIYKNDDIGGILLEALRESEDEENTCSECGKDIDEDEDKCEACLDKETNESMDSELESMVKIGKISKKDLERVIKFAEVCNPTTVKEDLIIAFGKKFEKKVLDRVALSTKTTRVKYKEKLKR